MAAVLPSAAVAAAIVAPPGRPDLRGLLPLAAADVLATAGLVVAQARGESAAVGASGGAAAFLLLAAAAIKVGAVPGLGTWRLAGATGPGGLAAVTLRAQGVALAVIGGLVLGTAAGSAAVAAAAAAACLLGGAVTLAVRDVGVSLSGVVGAGAALPFVALGLGGAVGTRAFLVLFPAFLVAAGVIVLAGWPGGIPPKTPRAGWRWLGLAALGAAALSLLGFPPGGGFPGTWLTLSLSGLRAEVSPVWLLVLGGVAVGLALAGLGAVPAIRSARLGAVRAIPAALAALALLYVGLQPVRLAVGWWVRIEADLSTPVVLAATGAPELPVLGGRNLAVIVGEAALLVAAVLALGRGLRDESPPYVSTARASPRAPLERVGGRLPGAAVWRNGLDLGVLVALELAAVVLVAVVVAEAAGSGFL
jgi:hypothetical protein